MPIMFIYTVLHSEWGGFYGDLCCVPEAELSLEVDYSVVSGGCLCLLHRSVLPHAVCTSTRAETVK